MTYTTALPASRLQASPASDEIAAGHREPPVRWFGASARLIGGQPDALYGWLEDSGGPCIVKQLDAQLVAYNKTLLAHEREALRQLAALGAPVPELLDLGRDDWLVTRFAGLSMLALQRDGAFGADAARLRFTLAEQLSAWVHLAQRLQPLADQGVLVLDLHQGNVVLPLTAVTHGQLRLTEPALIDQAHTLRAGMNLSRPVWLDGGMAHIAPELRPVLQRDQEALRHEFSELQADLPGDSRKIRARDAHSRRAWAEYRRPQHLQALVDSGTISCQAAMQYALGVALTPLLSMAKPPRAAALAAVVARMMAVNPADRFDSLFAAAAALRAAYPARLPLVSACHYPAIRTDDLMAPPHRQSTPQPQPVESARQGNAIERQPGTSFAGQGAGFTIVGPIAAADGTLQPATGCTPAQRVPGSVVDVEPVLAAGGKDTWMYWWCLMVAAGSAMATWALG